MSHKELPEVNFRIALVGAAEVGKSTLAMNFTGGIDYDDEGDNDMESVMLTNETGKYQIDLDYSKARYQIDIEEMNFKDIRGEYASEFDAVIYMFSCTDPESFISLREFFIRQIAGGKNWRFWPVL